MHGSPEESLLPQTEVVRMNSFDQIRSSLSTSLSTSPDLVVSSRDLEFLETLRKTFFAVVRTAIPVLIVYPLWILFVKIYLNKRTEQFQYSWILTTAGLSGWTSASFSLVFGTVTIALMILSLHHKSKKDSNHIPILRQLPFFFFYLCVVIVDVAIVSVIKASYVAYLLHDTSGVVSSSFVQLSFSICDIFWNKLICYFITSRLFHCCFLKESHQYLLYLLLLSINSILAPALATVITDKKCFSEAFVGIEPVNVQAVYNYCDFKFSAPDCSQTDNIIITTSFTPPYLYSYQCGTALFKHFLPILIFHQAILAFLRPLFWYLASSSRNYYIQHYSLLPKVLWPELKTLHPFNPNQAITEMTHQLTLFLTFGLVSPILALLIVLTLAISWLMWSVVVKRYYRIRKSMSNVSGGLNLQDETGGGNTNELTIPFQQIPITVLFSTVFLVLVAIDVAGDEGREEIKSILLNVALPCLCLLTVLTMIRTTSGMMGQESRTEGRVKQETNEVMRVGRVNLESECLEIDRGSF